MRVARRNDTNRRTISDRFRDPRTPSRSTSRTPKNALENETAGRTCARFFAGCGQRAKRKRKRTRPGLLSLSLSLLISFLLLLQLPLLPPPARPSASSCFAFFRDCSPLSMAEMTEAGGLADFNDGRGSTVATTMIHDHVDLRSAVHCFLCGVRSRGDARSTHTSSRFSERASELTNHISIRKPLDR